MNKLLMLIPIFIIVNITIYILKPIHKYHVYQCTIIHNGVIFVEGGLLEESKDIAEEWTKNMLEQKLPKYKFQVNCEQIGE